jgi:hypothetical protein
MKERIENKHRLKIESQNHCALAASWSRPSPFVFSIHFVVSFMAFRADRRVCLPIKAGVMPPGTAQWATTPDGGIVDYCSRTMQNARSTLRCG